MRARAIFFSGAALILVLAALRTWHPAPPRPQQVQAAIVPEQASANRPSRRARPAQPAALASIEDLQAHLESERQKLTPERAEAYLHENHRNPASLLAASRVFGDKAYLREAMAKYPNDPRVAFDAYFLSGQPRDPTNPAPPEIRHWLEQFKQSDPDNALPYYLAARDDFKAGRADLALQELQAASGKTTFNSYLLDSLQSTEEAYRAAGYSEVDAKWAAGSGLLLPHLQEAKRLGENIASLAVQYQNSGDTASAQNLLNLGLTLGDQVGGPGEFPLINTLVGIAIQKLMLGAMDPNSPYLDTGRTVQQQLDALNQYRQSFKPITAQEVQLVPQMSDADRINFFDRRLMFGEAAAVKWAAEKYGSQ